jgi:hypothetical protein
MRATILFGVLIVLNIILIIFLILEVRKDSCNPKAVLGFSIPIIVSLLFTFKFVYPHISSDSMFNGYGFKNLKPNSKYTKDKSIKLETIVQSLPNENKTQELEIIPKDIESDNGSIKVENISIKDEDVDAKNNARSNNRMYARYSNNDESVSYNNNRTASRYNTRYDNNNDADFEDEEVDNQKQNRTRDRNARRYDNDDNYSLPQYQPPIINNYYGMPQPGVRSRQPLNNW